MTKSSRNGARHTTVEMLRAENESLKKTIAELKSVNGDQLNRLVRSELLRDRIVELEKQIANAKGQ